MSVLIYQDVALDPKVSSFVSSALRVVGAQGTSSRVCKTVPYPFEVPVYDGWFEVV